MFGVAPCDALLRARGRDGLGRDRPHPHRASSRTSPASSWRRLMAGRLKRLPEGPPEAASEAACRAGRWSTGPEASRRGGRVEVEIGIGKSGRRAYGFDDIAIVPSRRTRDPEDVDISWELDAFHFELPVIGAAMDGVMSPAIAIEMGQLGGLGLPEPRGHLDPLRGPRRAPRGDRRAAGREGHPAHAGDLRRADQGRADRPAHPRDQGRRRHRVRVAHAPARRAVRQARARGRARPARHPGHGRVGRARVEDDGAAQPQAVHPRVRAPGDRRRLRVVLHRAAPHAHRRGRRARRRRPRPRVHHPRRARHRRARRPPPSPTPRARASATSTRPASTCTSSPTAGCAPAATSPRRSRAAPTR